MHADSIITSGSGYFYTDNYVVLSITVCHHKTFCAKGENSVNIHRELVSVCGDSALDYSIVNTWSVQKV